MWVNLLLIIWLEKISIVEDTPGLPRQDIHRGRVEKQSIYPY